MKTILLTIIATIIFLNVNAVTTYTVIKNTDPDSYTYRYDFDDAKCDPVMYGTLQWAIRKVLDTPGECRIEFNISGTSPITILLNYTLPTLEKKPTTIDATTQPGYSQGNPQIIIDGNFKLLTGLYFNNLKNSGVKGIVFKHFVSQAVMFNYANSFSITNCYFVENGSQGSKINPAALRIVSSTNGNIKGNSIGIDPSGNITGNSAFGMVLSDNSNYNTIGGINSGEGNVIVNNQKFGIWITNKSFYNKISGNIIYGSDRAIILEPDGNQLKHEPVIINYDNNSYLLKGGADPNDIIEVFGSNGNQSANEYIATVQAGNNGKWEVVATTNYSNYVATATDQQKNTSILSSPFHAPNALSRLISTDCDISEVLFSQILTAKPVYRAEQYEFMVTDANSGISENIVKNTNSFSLNELNMPIQLNTAYSISVRVKIGELWGQFGEMCKVTTVKSTTIQACKDEEIHHNISGLTVNTPVHITISFPNGVSGLNNASTFPTTTVLVDTTNPLMPQYSFNAPDTSFTFYYHIVAGCEYFSPTTQNILYSINQDGIITSDSFYLSSPWIVFDPIASQNIVYNNAFINVPFTRTFVYKNTGNTFNGDFLFKDTAFYNFNNTAIRITNIECTSQTTTVIQSASQDTSAFIKLRITDLKTDSIIIIRETVRLVKCPASYNNISHFYANYGCSNGSLCKQVQSQTDVAVVNEDSNDKPSLNYTLLTTGYQPCWSDSLERVIRIINSGGGIATYVYIGFVSGNAPYGQTPNITDHPIYNLEVFKKVGINEIPVPFNTTTPLYSNNEAVITTDSLFPNDTIYIRYYERINCIDSLNYDAYFNHTTHMHWEGFPWIMLNHPCNSVYKYYPDNNGYYNATWRRDFSLNQVFNNLIGTMPDGDVQWFNVSSSSLQIGNQWGGVIFDTNNSELIIELDLEPGLGLVDSNLYLSSNYNVTNLYANSIEFIPNVNHYAGGIKILAKFNFPDSMFTVSTSHNHGFVDLPNPSFYNFFNNFKVNFQLFADCHFASDTPTTITQKVFFNPNNTCSSQCLIPLSKVEDDIFILCPGCVLPGWNLSSFNITRTNLGYADDNNNNFPDSYPMQPANPSLAMIHNAMIGDTLEFNISGNTSDGGYIVDSHGDSIFVGFNNIGFDYKYGQMQLLFPMFNKLKYKGATGTISDNSGTYSFSLPSSTGSLFPNGFTISLDIDTLQQYGVPVTFNRFWTSNSLTLKPIFIVEHNLIDNTAPNPYYSIQGIDARMNMSGIQYPSGIEILTDAGTFAQAYPDSFLNLTPAQKAELNYWCTGWNGRFGAIGINYNFYNGPSIGHVNSYFGNLNPCNNIIHYYAYTEVGHQVYGGYADQFGEQVPWNSFSYEIRNLWMLDSLKINFPVGYQLDSVVFGTTQLTSVNGVTQYTCTPWSNNEGTWHIYDMTDTTATNTSVTIYPARNFEQITQSIGCNGVSHHRLTAYDETKRYRVYFVLKSVECAPPQQILPQGYPMVSYWSDFPGTTTGDTIINQPIVSGAFTRPDATLESNVIYPIIQDAPNSDIVLNMNIHTAGTYGFWDGFINHGTAENTFILIHSPSGTFTVDSIINIQNNQLIPMEGVISGDNVYGLGRVGATPYLPYTGPSNIRIFSSYNCENIIGKDSILIYTGWNCAGYPTNLNNVCYLDSQWVSFTVIKPGLQASLNVSDTLNICDTLRYNLSLTSTGVGNVDNVIVNIPVPQTNEYSYESGSAYLLFNGNTIPVNPVLLGIDTLSFNLSAPGLLDNFEQQTGHFIFNIIPSCSFYQSLNEVQLFISAENYCGNEILIPVISNRPNTIIGFPIQDSLLVNINMTDSVSGCGDSTLVSVTITNAGSNNTSALNTLQVILPNSYTWSSGDVASSVVGQTYTYNLASNIIPTDSQTIQFFIAGTSGNGIYNVIANTYVTQAIPCNNDTCIFAQSFIESTDTVQFNVIQLNATVNTVNPTCNGLCNGSASAVCTGIAPYTYAWSTGANTPTITGLCAGNFSLVVTDANGCKDTVLFTISNPVLFTATINSNSGNPCSTACTGSAAAQLSGGTAPFMYNWNTGDTTSSITNLCPDTFFVTVTDFNGCIATASVTIVNNLISPPVASISILNPDTNCLVAGTNVNFSSPNQAGVNYTWYYGDGNTGSIYNPSYPYSDYGYYCVMLVTSNQCGSASAHTTLFIQPQGCNCNTSYTFNDGTVINSTNNTWNSTNYGSVITVQGLVRVPFGQILTINDNVTVKFAPKGKIVVERGGKLRVHTVTLTSINSCSMWQGIEVWGDGSRVSNHPVQGNVNIRSSNIENAHIAVLLGRRKAVTCSNIDDANPFDNHFSGGTVYSVMSTYKNDGVGIKFIWKSNADGASNRIDSNTFICTSTLIDGNYLNTSPHRYPNSQNPWAGQANANTRTDIGIQANHIKFLKIKGCVFDNIDYGIFTIDNQRSVVLNCKFKNHRQGMHIENIMPTFLNSYDITMCTFDYIPGNTLGYLGQNDGTALYISGSRGDRIHDGNQFNNTYSTNLNTYHPYGIKTNNASSFEMTNNIFYYLTAGITIQNSIPFAGNIMAKASSNGTYSWYGNRFNLCKTGITTKNDNSYLCLRCNVHNSDIINYLYNINTESGLLADQGYNGWQTYTNLITKSRFGAGNKFNVGINKLGSVVGYNYYFQDSLLSPDRNPKVLATPISKYQITNVPFYTNSQSCPFPNFLPPDINLPISLNTPVFQRIDSLNNIALALETQYLTLLNNADKGHTIELLNEINAFPPSGQLKNMLMADSPLSDTVLKALNIVNPLSNGNYKNVMEENLPVTKNVVSSFNSRVETLPPGIKNQLKEKQVNNPGKITLGYLETKLSQAVLTKQLYFNEIIALLLDTLNDRVADATTLFESEATPAANMTLAANYISDSNYSAALSKLAMLPNDDSQIGEWKTYAAFLLNHLSLGKSLEELDSIQIDYIRTLANQCPEGIATVNAKAILMYLYREEIPACPENGIRTMRVENNNVHQINSSYLGDNYPDPFSRNTVIPYNLPEGSKGEIEITDVTGRIILTLSLQEGDNTLEIDSKGWANGIYFYGMRINNENIENKKMVKTE